MKESARTFMHACVCVCVCMLDRWRVGFGGGGEGVAWREAGEMERLGGAPLSI